MELLIFMKTKYIQNVDDLDPSFSEEQESEREIKILESILGSEALAKACTDKSFDYALRLRTGEVVRFVGATLLNREWINIELPPDGQWDTPNPFPFDADRGIDIRISDIVWVMDAPNGS